MSLRRDLAFVIFSIGEGYLAVSGVSSDLGFLIQPSSLGGGVETTFRESIASIAITAPCSDYGPLGETRPERWQRQRQINR